MNSDVSSLKNIGPTIAKRLNEIGIYDKDDLKKIGSIEAYKRICQKYPDKTIPVCYYLYSLEGALTNIHWNSIPKKSKEKLLDGIKS